MGRSNHDRTIELWRQVSIYFPAINPKEEPKYTFYEPKEKRYHNKEGISILCTKIEIPFPKSKRLGTKMLENQKDNFLFRNSY